MPAPILTQPTPLPADLPLVAPKPLKTSPFRRLGLFIIIVLLFLAIVLGFVYYQKKQTPQGPPPPENITHWGPASDQAYYSELINQFQAQNPNITIEYLPQSPQDYRERLQTALGSDNGPNVFQFHNTWPIMLGAYIAPLPETVLSKANFDTLFYPVNQIWLKNSAGKYLGFPLAIDGLGLYVNHTLLQGAGLAPPTTWAQLMAAAETLTIKSEGKILRGGVALGTTTNVEYWPDILGALLFQNNADPQNPNTKAGQDVLTFYTDFVTKHKLWDAGMPPSTYAFAHEKVAFMIAPSYVANEVFEQNPALPFSVIPLPSTPDNNSSWATYWALGVTKNQSPSKQTASWQWLSFLLDKESLREFYAQKSSIALVGPPFPRTDMADQLISDAYAGAYLNQASQGQSWYLSSHTMDNGVNDQIIKIYETVVNTILSGDPAEEALATTSEDIQSVLSTFTRRR